jgi:mono/diheme cytochrome c family protein
VFGQERGDVDTLAAQAAIEEIVDRSAALVVHARPPAGNRRPAIFQRRAVAGSGFPELATAAAPVSGVQPSRRRFGAARPDPSLAVRRIAMPLAPRPVLAAFLALLAAAAARAQMTDQVQAPNAAHVGIKKSYAQEIGADRGDVDTPDSSAFVIARDPYRAIRRGRQLFQRKFTMAEGLGPRTNDGIGDLGANRAIGAGLSDSCAACHGRPFGSAGAGGNVFTRTTSRDAPHLFGLGLKEMLGDEITRELRGERDQGLKRAAKTGSDVVVKLVGKGIEYGGLIAHPDGTVDTSGVEGVDPDLRVRPFFAHGGTISIREFVVGALNNEMGMQAPDPDLLAASAGSDVTTPAGMLLSGTLDAIEAPHATTPSDDADHDGVIYEVPTSIVDYLEFYLLNYFKPGRGEITADVTAGRRIFGRIGCAQCHAPDLQIEFDRRVADVSTVYDEANSNGIFSHEYATAALEITTFDDGSGLPLRKIPALAPYLVQDVYADFKRHDLGPNFHEMEFDGSVNTMFMTTPLWGVADTAPYGHDGRSVSLTDVILRHGGEAQAARDAFAGLTKLRQQKVLAFLGSLVLFSPEDTASNLNPVDKTNPNYPMQGHGSISLTPLFNDPTDGE